MHCNAEHYHEVNSMGMTSVRMPDELLSQLDHTYRVRFQLGTRNLL